MKGKCEICKRQEDFLIFQVAESFFLDTSKLMCLECDLSFLVQFFEWDDNDVKDYIKWMEAGK